MGVRVSEGGRCDATVEAVRFPYVDAAGFRAWTIMAYECRLTDTRSGLDVRTVGRTPDSAAMRALGAITGCWWQYAAARR